MRITVDISNEHLADVLRTTGIPNKSPAVAKAIEEYLLMKTRQRFARSIREKRLHYSTTNEEIERADAVREARLKYGKRKRP